MKHLPCSHGRREDGSTFRLAGGCGLRLRGHHTSLRPEARTAHWQQGRHRPGARRVRGQTGEHLVPVSYRNAELYTVTVKTCLGRSRLFQTLFEDNSGRAPQRLNTQGTEFLSRVPARRGEARGNDWSPALCLSPGLMDTETVTARELPPSPPQVHA